MHCMRLVHAPRIRSAFAAVTFCPEPWTAYLAAAPVRALPYSCSAAAGFCLQSEWLLDALAPATWQPALPAIYELLLLPARAIYWLAGPTLVGQIDAALGLSHAGHHLGIFLRRGPSLPAGQLLADTAAGSSAWLPPLLLACTCLAVWLLKR